jgi:hypothetical protein
LEIAELRERLMQRRAELEQQRGVLCTTTFYADLNALTGAIQQCDWQLALIGEGEVMDDPDGIPLEELIPGAVIEEVTAV